MRVIGIDPGNEGAFVLLDDGAIVACQDMPLVEVRDKKRVDPAGVAAIIAEFGPVDLVALEDVQGVQQSGATSAFSFGRGKGIIEGVLAAFERPYVLIRPQEWTKNYGGSDKGAHLQCAKQLWPAYADTLFKFKKNADRADAALLARHASLRS